MASNLTSSGRAGTGSTPGSAFGGHAMIGEAATFYLPSAEAILAGSGRNNKWFPRESFVGLFYFGPHLDVQVVTQHGWDRAWFDHGYGDPVDFPGNPNNKPGTFLPPARRRQLGTAFWLSRIMCTGPQLIFVGRHENIRTSPVARASNAANLGNISTYTVGFRYNPFMNAGAGFARHNEYNWLHSDGTSALGSSQNMSEVLTGFDFDF